ncbi:MAG: SH3 domain-containing protein [Treponema sp.]|nr:SH3 domain-containing protein [Treponema sp.]
MATYCAYSESEYAWLNEAVATNDFDGMEFTFPRHADGSCDYDEGAWKSARKSSGGIPLHTGKAMTTKENLRVHSFEKTTSPVLITLAAGTSVEILGVGGEETIDGITSKWVHVMLAPGTTGTDGKHMTGTMGGWCFGGLVSATEKEPESADAPATEHAEPTENAAFPEAAESPSEEAAGADAKKAAALPIAPIAAGVAVFVILLAAILLAVRKRKGGKD